MKRIFLVGAPRSGTNILQSVLASHPKITSFPETKFFHHLWDDRLTQKLPDRLREFFYEEVCRPDLFDKSQVYSGQSTSDRITWFVGILDRLAREEHNEIWLEKTPEHVYYVQDIISYLPQAKFIHIVRNPLDTVASMRKATQDSLNNATWGGEWTLQFCVERWKRAALINNYFRNDKKHLLIRYEDLLEDKVKILSRCCYFIDVAYDPEMLRNYRAQAIALSLGHPWNKGIDQEIKPAIVAKYKDFFSESEVKYILGKTEELRSYFGYIYSDADDTVDYSEFIEVTPNP